MDNDRGHDRDFDGAHRQGQHQRAVGLAEMPGHGVGMAHHAEGAPHDHAKQPEKHEQGGGVALDVSEQRLLEGVDQSHADEPGDGRRDGRKVTPRQVRVAANRLDGLALIHWAPFPAPSRRLQKHCARGGREANLDQASLRREAITGVARRAGRLAAHKALM